MGWSGSTNSIKYAFTSEVAAKGDFDLVISRYRSRTEDLSKVMTLKINNVAIDLSDIYIPYTDINQYYEWDQLVLKNIDIIAGKNTIELVHTSSSIGMPNQLMLNVFQIFY